MISCEQALELISLELDGLLDDTDREQLERHLAGCAPCQALREDLSLLRRELPGLEAGPPEPLCPNVLQKISVEALRLPEAGGAGRLCPFMRRTVAAAPPGAPARSYTGSRRFASGPAGAGDSGGCRSTGAEALCLRRRVLFPEGPASGPGPRQYLVPGLS